MRALLVLGCLLVARVGAPAAYAERVDQNAQVRRPQDALHTTPTTERMNVSEFALSDHDSGYDPDHQTMAHVLGRGCIVRPIRVSDFALSADDGGAATERRALRSDGVPRSWRMDVSEYALDDGQRVLGEALPSLAEHGPFARPLTVSEFQPASGDTEAEPAAMPAPRKGASWSRRIHVSEF